MARKEQPVAAVAPRAEGPLARDISLDANKRALAQKRALLEKRMRQARKPTRRLNCRTENSAESSANLAPHLRSAYPAHADEAVKLYVAKTNEEAKRAAQELTRDQGVGYWLELQAHTGKATVYRYEFDRARPQPPGSSGPDMEPRAYHSAEIEFVFSVLPGGASKWTAEDMALSKLMSSYWANFAKTADPNGPGLAPWPAYQAKDGFEVMHFNAESIVSADEHRARFELIGASTPK